jgi:hypothetical protein
MSGPKTKDTWRDVLAKSGHTRKKRTFASVLEMSAKSHKRHFTTLTIRCSPAMA